MGNSSRVDYIIVGQGLAGSAVAFQLIRHGKKILVIDKKNPNAASVVAAGLFNPITGYKMSKTWLADTLFPYLHSFYRDVEAVTNKKFFHSLVLYRPFLSIEEQNEWMGKSESPAFEPYIQKIITSKTIAGVHDDYGGLLLNQCGYLDTTIYLKAIQEHVQKSGFLLEEVFDDNELTLSDESIRYKNYTANKIIFCEGENIVANKWFSWLPISPLKGETLKILCEASTELIINRGVYMVPSVAKEFRVGATYNPKDSLRNTTVEARNIMVEKLKELINIPFEIIGQEWGMRPTTPDRRPIIGSHPLYPSILIFNGLGTKGVSLAPYFSDNFLHWMEGATDLNKEVDVNRYKSLYSKFTK